MTETQTPPETMPAPAAAALADARARLQQLGGCALLVGVEAYAGLPAAQQLHAGRNDVLAYWKVCRRLGYRPEDIRVLTSPALTPDDIVRAEQELGPELHPEQSKDEIRARASRWFAGPAPVVLGEATRDGIVKGVEWLAGKLVYTVKLAWEGGTLEQELAALPGLLAYSGHGAHRGGDLVLCPSDVGPGLERAVSFAELRALIDAGDDLKAPGTPRPADNLTVVLDCCFAAAAAAVVAGAAGRASRVPTLTPRGSGPVPSPKQEIGSRVFCASGRDEPSYQCVLGGHWHGAFTWAFTRALEQWKTAPSGQFRQSTVSHVELLFRARMLLEALSVHQHPVLVDRIGNLPVFLHGGDAASAASADPNTDRHSGQIDPVNGFAYYRFFDADRNALAEIIATGTADDTHKSGLEAGWEYWKIGGDRFKSSEYATVFVSKVASGEWHSVGQVPFTAADADFSCPVGMPWSAFSGPAASYLKQSEGYTHGGFDVDVSLQNGLWSGQITFYRDTLNGLLFGTIVSGSQRSLTMGSYLPAQQCSITAQDLRQPLRSGNRYVLFDLAKNVSIHKAHETNGGYYATTDQDGGSQPQTLELVGGSPTGATPIRSGDEIYIRSVEAKLTGQYLRPQGSGANDLWYQTGSTPGQVHTWIIRSFPRDERPDGAVISLGDLVTFENKEQRGRYMGANQGDGYLSTTGLLRAWTLSAS